MFTGRDFLFRTQVHLDLDGFAEPEVAFQQKEGRRIILLFAGLKNKSGRRRIAVGDTCLKEIRLEQESKPPGVRVILEIQDNVGFDALDVAFFKLPGLGLRPRGRLTISLTQKSL